MILSLQKHVINCGDNKPKWNDLNKVQSTEIPKFTSDCPTPIDCNDIFKQSFFNTFLNQANKAMDKKKINKKTAKYWKNETVKYEFSKKNLNENVDSLVSSSLGRRLEVGDERDYEDAYEYFVQNSKNKKLKRNQLRKHKKTTPKKSALKKIRQSTKRNSHINHRHLNKVKSMKKNKRHLGKYLSTEDNEIYETNFMTFIDDTEKKSSTNMTKSPLCICEDNISSQESDCIVESYKIVTSDNLSKTKRKFDPEQDVIKDMQLRVFDRILNSALGTMNNNNQYNDECVNKEKIREQETFSPANKCNENENQQIEILKPISKTSYLFYLNENSPKDRSQLYTLSDTKVKKNIRKTKRKNSKPKKKKKFRRSDYEIITDSKRYEVDSLIMSALNEGAVDHNSDEYNFDEVYDNNVDSHNVYNHKISDTKEVTNLLMSNLSSYVERISYPYFIHDNVKDCISVRVTEDKNCTQKCDSANGRKVDAVIATEQGRCNFRKAIFLYLQGYFLRRPW